MSQTMPLFDLAAGQKLKKRGMALAESKQHALLCEVRAYLYTVANGRKSRTASADDAYEYMDRQYPGVTLGKASGSLFKIPGWEFAGIWISSWRKSNHARMIRVWRLK